jgi:hypothetical protein
MRQPPDRLRGRPTPETASSNVQVTGTALDFVRLQAPADAAPDPAGVAALLELSAERDAWQRVSLAREREAYRCGREDGIEEGRRLEAGERDALWHANAAQLARGETFAELERRRSA